jgi:hypothetical protein
LWNNKHLLRIKAKLLLDLLAVVSFERVAVDTACALEFGTEANGSRESDHGWLVLDLSRLHNGSFDAVVVVIAILYLLCVPAVSFESLGHIFSERDLGVAV